MFFGDYYRMHVKLVADAVENTIREEASLADCKSFRPGLAPFHTHAWPWTTDPKSGTGPASMEEALRPP